MALLLLSVFIFGALAVIALEALVVWILILHLSQKIVRDEVKAKSESPVHDLDASLYDKQGTLWVLEPDKVPKFGFEDQGPSEQRRRKEILEVTPVKKQARIKDNSLILSESDGSHVEILLSGCTIVSVSATNLPSRKWAKRYPIKIESKESAIYRGSSIVYVYLETSWDKESWCRALRLASYKDEEKIAWFSNMKMEFLHYLALLNAGYPSLLKPSAGSSSDLLDKSVKLENSSSKVRHFIKKLAKKASKSGHDYKAGGVSVSGHDDRKLNERSYSFEDSTITSNLARVEQTGKSIKISSDDSSVQSSISASSEAGGGNHLPGTSGLASNYKSVDEGTLCLNLLISRLFFDVKNNPQINTAIQNRIQRTLSNMRIPTYIEEVKCTAVNTGKLPPRVLAMRVLPSDMNELWALELDVEYVGGMVLGVETRLKIQELESEKERTNFDTDSAREVTSDLLEDFEHLGEEFKLSEMAQQNIKDDVDSDDNENFKTTGQTGSQGSKWKTLVNSITKQVSQVPLALEIRVSSLSGTVRLCVKPPPSDQIWFCFTSMPDIQFDLESSVGDHQITSGRLALFLINRFKVAISDTLVLPNNDSIGIPWMLAEKDDWIPRKNAPLMWYRSSNQESVSSNSTRKRAVTTSEPKEAAPHTIEPNRPMSQVKQEKSKSPSPVLQAVPEPLSSSGNESTISDDSLKADLKAPLLKKEKSIDIVSRSIEDKQEIHIPSRSMISSEGQVHSSEEDEPRQTKRIGTRERMLGLGKKMGEKLEVKRRHFEEKGRSFVEKMRTPRE